MDREQANDDLEQQVRQASGGEPAAGDRAGSSDQERAAEERRAVSTSEGSPPDPVRDEDDRAATERVERMQQEGRGIRGVSTQGRTDQTDEQAIEDATRGEEG